MWCSFCFEYVIIKLFTKSKRINYLFVYKQLISGTGYSPKSSKVAVISLCHKKGDFLRPYKARNTFKMLSDFLYPSGQLQNIGVDSLTLINVFTASY